MSNKSLSELSAAEYLALTVRGMEIAVEREIATRTIRAMLAQGYTLSVDSGGDEHDVEKSIDEGELLEAMFAVDECDLLVHRPNGSTSVVTFIYNNGDNGAAVISDYSTSLEHVLAPINKYAATLEPK